MIVKKLVYPIFIALIASGCTSTYKLTSDAPTAQLTVRSPQGRPVEAFTYDEAQNCVGRKALRTSKKGKAKKSFQIEAGQQSAFSFYMRGHNAGGQSCVFTMRFDVEADQHYVVSIVSDKGKRRCNNRLVNAQNPSVVPTAELIKTSPGSRLSNENAWCKDDSFIPLAAADGRFTSTIYQHTMSGNQFGVYTNTEAQQER